MCSFQAESFELNRVDIPGGGYITGFWWKVVPGKASHIFLLPQDFQNRALRSMRDVYLRNHSTPRPWLILSDKPEPQPHGLRALLWGRCAGFCRRVR